MLSSNDNHTRTTTSFRLMETCFFFSKVEIVFNQYTIGVNRGA